MPLPNAYPVTALPSLVWHRKCIKNAGWDFLKLAVPSRALLQRSGIGPMSLTGKEDL